MTIEVRLANNTQEDLDLLAEYCNKLAEFDGYKGNVEADKLSKQLFGYDTNVRSFLAFRNEEPIGFIITYECFTVYHGERGLYVSGAYIIDKYRHRGYGAKLFKFAAQYALDNGFSFMNWIVEDNNDKANAIYQKMGATMSKGWTYVRISEENVKKLVDKVK